MSNQGEIIIGILCIDVSRKLSEYGTKIKSYIAASYPKFVEGEGARSIPIWINKPESYYSDMLKNINGVLIPGGAVHYESKKIEKPEDTNYCVESIAIILRLAREMFDDGIYFPVWGTCLGFQIMLNESAGGMELREDCGPLSKSMPLELESDFRKSKMFANISKDMEKNLQEEPFAYHSHRYCITQETLNTAGISSQWTVTGVNHDDRNLKFITTIEHKKYPFYGVQFHPERTIYEWTSPNISHTEISINCVQHFAKFFVSECRKNSNHFKDANEVNRHIIFNFPITFTKGTPWLQCYLFGKNIDYPEG